MSSKLPRLPRLEPEKYEGESGDSRGPDVIYDIYEDGTGHYWSDDPRVDVIMRSHPTPDDVVKALEAEGFKVLVRRPDADSAHRQIADAMAEARKKVN